MDDVEKRKLMAELRERISDVEPLPHEDFFTRTDTLLRFLKARQWSVDEAEKQLRATVEWRREIDPLNVDCRWCHERPGYHCIRQVGFDKQRRPVIYACLAQASCSATTVADTVVHMTHLFENAKITMNGDVSQWVFVVDCTGMTLAACNPRVGHALTQAMATYYPERLGLVICIHHNAVFHGVWNAFKIFLDPNTAAKMQLLRKKPKFREAFIRLFDEELATWLMEEVKLNKRRPMLASQRQFWKGVETSNSPTNSKPTTPTTKNAIEELASSHDPRGCRSYVQQYIEPYLANHARNSEDRLSTLHQPHPNIVDELRGCIASDVPPAAAAADGVVVANSNGHDADSEGAAAAEATSDDEDETISPASLDHISEQFQIPKHVYEQHQLKTPQKQKH